MSELGASLPPARGRGRLRCEAHDLACDRRGHCVLCRRALGLASESPASRPPSSWGGTAPWMVLAALGVLGLAVATALWLRQEAKAPTVASAGPVVPEPARLAQAPNRGDEARRRAERARTERMLHEAERRRLARASARTQASQRPAQIPQDPGALSAPEPSTGTRGQARDENEAALERRAARLRQERERAQARRSVERARSEVEITMYSARWCGVCSRARAYMRRQGIAFVERDVDEDTAARAAFRRLNPRRTLPTLDIDGQVVTGFSPRSLERAVEHAALARLR